MKTKMFTQSQECGDRGESTIGEPTIEPTIDRGKKSPKKCGPGERPYHRKGEA
jgi:hypothetical protein